MANVDAEWIKTVLGLRPLPVEGGYFAQSYRAEDVLPAESLPGRYGGDRRLGTAIYYLLTPDTFSALHRLPTDEVFHFYLGDPVEQVRLYPDGTGETVLLGSDLAAGMRPQAVVPRGVWQGARLAAGGRHGYALLGTTMAPGFDDADYEPADRAALTAEYPAFAALITALTPAG